MQQSMLLITSIWNGKKSFRMMPITENCPFAEGIYDPDSKVLVMMSKIRKQGFHMVARLDDNGDPIPAKKARSTGKPYQEQRVTLETFEEHYISEKKEIEDFIERFAVNTSTFDYKSLMTPPVVLTPEQPKVQLLND